MLTRGFLGYQTSFMLDFVVVALVIVVPLMIWSLVEVKARRFENHRKLQMLLALILLVAVTLFEVDLQWIQGGWRNIVDRHEPPLSTEVIGRSTWLLRIHLVFAISTPILWVVTLIGALRNYAKPAQPSAYSTTHKRLGWLSMIDLVLTSVTGVIFYVATFVLPTL